MKSPWRKTYEYFINDGPKTILIILWIGANVAFILERGIYFYNIQKSVGPEHVYNLLGWTLNIARGSAASIKLNCALLLLFVLRNFLSWVRGTWAGNYIPVDKALVFHRYVAWAMFFGSLIHVTAHWFNLYYIRTATGEVLGTLKVLGMADQADPNGPIVTKSIYIFSYLTIFGSTGQLMNICLFLIYSTTLTAVRSNMFEIFWISHHLFLPFYILTMFHGAGAIFQPPDFYMWVVGPLVLYAIERIIRILKSKQPCIILQAIQHPSNVIELRMKKTSFKYISGQYLFLSVPYISNYEWHPFTISSAPDDDYLSIHIRRAGDWTGMLCEMFNPEGRLGVAQENMVNAPNGEPIVMIDGPFGAASEDVVKFEHLHLWAAGIGVTPFSSILKDLRYQMAKGNCRIKTVEFYWINRDSRCFEWFMDLLQDLESTCDFLTINLFFTGKSQDYSGSNADKERDVITGLETRTHHGRPDIKAIFKQKVAEYAGCTVGVFFCGPPLVSKTLYSACRRETNAKTKTFFKFHKENF